MKRTEFLALMLSPLVLPFVKKPEKITFPNKTKWYFYSGGRGGGKTLFNSHVRDASRYLQIDEETRRKWLYG